MLNRHSITITMMISLLAVFLVAMSVQAQQDSTCPWRISKIEVSKWTNGHQKSSIWVSGSFPILPGVSERPNWFVNGKSVGKSQIFMNKRMIPNSSSCLKSGTNTISVQFTKPPYNGASHTVTIQDFDWDHVPNGGYRSYRAY